MLIPVSNKLYIRAEDARHIVVEDDYKIRLVVIDAYGDPQDHMIDTGDTPAPSYAETLAHLINNGLPRPVVNVSQQPGAGFMVPYTGRGL